MKKNFFFITIFFLITFISCKDRYPDEFYGTYEKNDSFNIQFSKIKFYSGNFYSFYSYSCLDGTRDTGEFCLDNNVLTFKSFNPVDTNVYQKFDRRLTKFNFIYKPKKVCFLRSTNPSLRFRNGELDTMLSLTKTH